jgi:hypothetical protein
LVGELVVLVGGELPWRGRIVGQRSPHGAPGCSSQRGLAATGDGAVVLVIAGAVLAGAVSSGQQDSVRCSRRPVLTYASVSNWVMVAS